MNSEINTNHQLLPEGVECKTINGSIDIYENIFSKEVSNKIINIFEDANKNIDCPIKYSNALIGDGADGGNFRSNLIMYLHEHQNSYDEECSCEVNSVISFIKEKLSIFVRYYSEKYDVEIAFDEGLQLLKYDIGKQYKAHIDYGPVAQHRILSGLIYLNPGDYLGGGTSFINFNNTIEPETPSLALFPSNYAYKHAARPVFEGNKYAIVTWFGPPWMDNRS